VTGFAGLVGSGKSRVWRAVMGLNRTLAGKVVLNGKDMTGARTGAVIAAGVHYLPPDRKNEGLVLSASASDNIALGMLGTHSLRGRRAVDAIAGIAKTVGLDRPMLRRLASQLSGGNQQKVLIARWLMTKPRILILDEPTRGIDVGAKYEIYMIVNDLAAAGKGVIVISSEMPELLGICDRIYVMNEGKFVDEMPAKGATQEMIMASIMRQYGVAAACCW
jgi:putative multiple sugar transport system ATP-binding protein